MSWRTEHEQLTIQHFSRLTRKITSCSWL